MNEKPKDPEEYKYWLKKEFDIHIDKRTETHYNHVAINLKSKIENSIIWIQISENLKNYSDSYNQQHKSSLFVTQDYTPKIETKDYDSFLEKTYRKNVLQNNNWPNPPDNGWILPKNWYHSIDDIIRTTIVVKYLDGVEFVVKNLENLYRSNSIDFSRSCEAKKEGYYAAHMYLKQTFEIPDLKWKPKTTEIFFEIHVMTELQDLIKKLLHKYYEEKRIKDIEDLKKIKKNWQWDYGCDEFAANYLGHILHYVEGMIIKIRDKQE